MPLGPLNDPLLRAPRSHAPTIAGMTEAANTATPEQLADFVDAIGASGGGGGGHPPTDLGATATPTGVTVTSSTGADALLPLATATNAGLMAPAQHAKLDDLPTAAQLSADQAAQDLEIGGKAPATHTHTPAAIGAATTAQGAKADSALQPGVLPVGTTLPAAQISDATTPGRALLTAADAAAQRTALALGNVSNTADADKPVSTAQALAIAAATTADAIADTLEAAATVAPADLARIQASVSGYRTKPANKLAAMMSGAGPVFAHLYGNSFIASGQFWRITSQLSQRIIIVKNSGIGGYTSAQVLAKLQADGLDATATVMPFCEGTNDASQAVPIATHIANMRAIAQYAIDRGVVPIPTLTAPSDTATQATTRAYHIAELVLWESMGVPVLDPWIRYTDTDGTWTTGASTDSTHPGKLTDNGAAIDLLGQLSGASIAPLIPTTNVGQGVVGANVLQLTDTNADGLPDGWSALTLTGHTYNAATDYSYPFRGKRASINLTQSAAGYLFKSVTYTIGKRYRVTGVLSVSANTNMLVEVFVRLGAIGDQYLCAVVATQTDKLVQLEYVVPVGTTNAAIYLKFSSLAGGAYSGTVEWGCFDMYDIAANTY